MSVILLATIGGIISAVSTSAGSLLAPLFGKFEKLRHYHMSMDFALGVMLSAVAFSLVGPELIKGQNLNLVFSGLIIGCIFIYFTHKMIEAFSSNKRLQTGNILLISALIFHNFPEGMGAGASLGGMDFRDAIPLQVAISIQNIAEGLLLTLLLKSLGLKLVFAVIGGIASGFVEMSGAVMAGFFMQETLSLLPFFLSLAGGAMMMSVGLEVIESYLHGRRLAPSQFLGGLLVIPITNLILQ